MVVPADTLLTFVGKRDDMVSPTQFAMSAVAVLGARLDLSLQSVRNGDQLVALAKHRRALSSGSAPQRGDLLTFDNVKRATPASMVGVVTNRRPDGTVEFVYLGRGVVRRGYVNPAQPRRKRDPRGRVLNTFLRSFATRTASGLAGELFSHHIALDRLSNPR